jgi:ribosomal RNA methyltransferase Nop2
VTVEENEGVVQYVLRKRPNVRIVDTGLGTFGSEGFKKYMNKRFDDKMNLTRRYFPHRENVDGFFVCKLKKFGPSPIGATANGNVEGTMKDLAINVDKKSNGVEDEDSEKEDVFGGFNEEEDEKYIANAEKKWLKKRGLDPHAASRKGKKEDAQTNGKTKK